MAPIGKWEVSSCSFKYFDIQLIWLEHQPKARGQLELNLSVNHYIEQI